MSDSVPCNHAAAAATAAASVSRVSTAARVGLGGSKAEAASSAASPAPVRSSSAAPPMRHPWTHDCLRGVPRDAAAGSESRGVSNDSGGKRMMPSGWTPGQADAVAFRAEGRKMVTPATPHVHVNARRTVAIANHSIFNSSAGTNLGEKHSQRRSASVNTTPRLQPPFAVEPDAAVPVSAREGPAPSAGGATPRYAWSRGSGAITAHDSNAPTEPARASRRARTPPSQGATYDISTELTSKRRVPPSTGADTQPAVAPFRADSSAPNADIDVKPGKRTRILQVDSNSMPTLREVVRVRVPERRVFPSTRGPTSLWGSESTAGAGRGGLGTPSAQSLAEPSAGASPAAQDPFAADGMEGGGSRPRTAGASLGPAATARRRPLVAASVSAPMATEDNAHGSERDPQPVRGRKSFEARETGLKRRGTIRKRSVTVAVTSAEAMR